MINSFVMNRISLNDLEQSVQQSVWEQTKKGLKAIDIGTKKKNYDDAVRKFQTILDYIKQLEQQKKCIIHKGHVMYELGKIHLISLKTKLALEYFLKAYAEDVLYEMSVKKGNYYAEDGNAFRMLFNYFRITIDAVNSIRKQCKHNVTANSTNVLQQLNYRRKIQNWIRNYKDWPTPHQYSTLGFPEAWERRVFIGGYYGELEILYDIKEAVINAEPKLYNTPIIASQHYLGKHPREIREKTLLLLHTCKYAIFEVSTQAGQLMEIERSHDYGNKVLVLYKKGFSPSSMVKSIKGIKIRKYRQSNHLANIINDFLHI